jgi:hypothetical protein
VADPNHHRKARELCGVLRKVSCIAYSLERTAANTSRPLKNYAAFFLANNAFDSETPAMMEMQPRSRSCS